MNEMSLIVSSIWILAPRLVVLSRRFGRCGLDRGSISWGACFRGFKDPPPFPVCSLLPSRGSKCEPSAITFLFSLPCFPRWWWWTLILMEPYAQINLHLYKWPWPWCLYHSNRKVLRMAPVNRGEHSGWLRCRHPCTGVNHWVPLDSEHFPLCCSFRWYQSSEENTDDKFFSLFSPHTSVMWR